MANYVLLYIWKFHSKDGLINNVQTDGTKAKLFLRGINQKLNLFKHQRKPNDTANNSRPIAVCFLTYMHNLIKLFTIKFNTNEGKYVLLNI